MPFTPTPTTGDDVLTDTTGDESVNALAGNDQITVTGGFDNVNGNTGRDRLVINYAAATQGVVTDGGFSGSVAAGYTGRIWQGTAAFTVDFLGIEDFTVTTGNSNDSITVGNGNDVVNLGDGDDFVDFGAGNDSGNGGTGTDGFSANMGSATAAIGINLVTGVAGAFSNFKYLGTLTTGSGNDVIVTRADVSFNETISTGAGTDSITVARGFDTVNGGTNRDRLIIDYSGATQGVFTDGGFSGSVGAGYVGRIWDGSANYVVDFSAIEDFTVSTGNGNDTITVGDGNDVIYLGGGDDFANFGSGNDSGDGGTGTDGFSANLGGATAAIGINLVTGVSATFSSFEYLGTLTTGSGNDVIVTRANVVANETINTGAGSDTITVARGFDTVNGGTNRDRLIIDYSGATQGVITDGGFSGSVAAGYVGRIWDGSANYVVDFSAVEDFTVTTGNGNDTITVGDGNDVINLGGGDDFANFGSGNDSGDGGTGTDGFSANLGSATAAIRVNLVTGVSATFRNFEYLGTLTTGSGADTIVTRNIIRNEAINTGDGDDTITVAGGFDTVAGGAGRDRLIIDYSGATQGVFTDGGFSGSLAAGYTGRIWQGTANYTVDFTGIEDFTITGGTSSDTILTGDGDDEYRQIAQDSPFYLRDTANLGGGIDRISVDARGTNGALANANVSYSGSGEITLYGNGKLGFTNVESFFLQGGNVADDLRGLDYADRFDGNAGNDRIAGRGGDDDLRGGAGADVIDGDGRVTILLAADNQNNAGTGVSDNDFRVTGNYTAANPFEADLAVGTENVGMVRLRIRATDIESQATDPAGVGSMDQVYVNDVLVGMLAQGADGATGDTIIQFEAALLASGTARVRIQNTNTNTIYNMTIQDIELTVEKTGDDRLDGGSGVDQLVGGRGDDVYVVDQDRDQAQEQAGQGTDTVLSQGRWFTLGANVENLTAELAATPVASTAESQINTDIVSATQHPRSVTVLDDGGYVVTWQDVNNSTDARARVFNADGTARSAEFTVNPAPAGSQGQYGLAAVALDSGGFLVAYYDTTSGPNGERIAGRVYDASGVAVGGEYTLTDTAGTFDSFPAMARLDDGRIALITQNGGAQDGNATFGIRYTLLNADGSAGPGAPIVLQTTTAGDQIGPSVTRLDDGRLIVVWESGEPGGKVFRGRFIAADGTVSGNDFVLSAPGGESPDPGEVRAQVTALVGGGFAVAWGITNEIVGRVFDNTGTAVGEQFTLNQRTDGAQTTVAITRLSEGGFMAAWTSDNGQDGDAHGIVARLFNADGSARGDDFVVNQIGTRFQLFPELATLQDGRVVVVFSSDVPGSGSDYEAKQVILDTTPDQTLVGNELANTVTGGLGNDLLAGSGGGDTVNGGAGDDVIFGGGFVGSGTNLVVNGSFETQDGTNVTSAFILGAADGTYEGIAYKGVSSLFGWQRGNANPIELNTANGSTIFDPADGTADVNLEYAPGQNQSIFQDIAGLAAGDKYLLTFAANQFSSNTTFTAIMQVVWNGVVIDTITPQTKTPGLYTFVLEAAATGSGAGGANRLEFREISSADGGGTTIDAISLETLVAAPDMAVGALGPNLITNGSFEQRDAITTSRDYALANPNTDFNGGEPLYANSNQLLGWGFLTGTTRVEFNTDNPNNPRNEFQTGDGLVGLDMEIAPNEQAGIFQDVAGLTSGDRYRITVSVAAPIGPGSGTVAVQVIWNGRVVGTVTPTGTTPVDYSFDVFAQANGAGAGGANRLAFQEVGGNDGQGRGVVLDNVRLNLVAAAAVDDDVLNGGTGNDTLYGGGGDDLLDGGIGADVHIGGLGDDTYFLDSAGDSVVELAGEGLDIVFASFNLNATAVDYTDIETFQLTGTATRLRGNSAVNTLIANVALGSELFGFGGSDILIGHGGNDLLDGGTGTDTMQGGAGDDSYVIDSTADVVTEAVGEGFDLVLASFNLTASPILYANIESFGLTGSATQLRGSQFGNTLYANELLGSQLFGFGGADVLFGSDGADLLDGGSGDDEMRGGAGDDGYFVYQAGDTVTELADEGFDYVRSAVNYTLGANLEELRLVGAATVGTGNELANTLRGGREGATLAGLDGDDTIYGSTKSDTILGGNGLDTLFGNSGIDTIYGGADNDTINGGGNGDFLYGDDGNDALRGAEGNDQLYGGTGNDILRGELNNDTLRGEAGADSLFGDEGIDILIGGADRDIMTGGLGADDFTFDEGDFAGLTANTADRIVDFNVAQGDDIDLSAIDAILGGADDAFTYLGNAAFSNVAGQVRWAHEGSNTMIYLDINGDATADYAIRLDGNINLLASSFIL